MATQPQHQKFDAKSESYEKGRPNYPEEALRFLYEQLHLSSEMFVADVGAGTGILTRMLERHFAEVIAIEPNDEMRSRISSRGVRGTAENTGLPNQSVNAIFAAQAFHWFEIEMARHEFRRVLKEPYAVALLWNDRETTGHPRLEKLDQLMGSLREGKSPRQQADEFAIARLFECDSVNSAEFAHETKLSREGLRALVLSRSYAPREGSRESEELINAVDALFDAEAASGAFTLPYRTHVYWGQLRES